MRLLAISGSLRADSLNATLLRAAAGALPAQTDFELYDDLKAVPPFDEDDEAAPGPAVTRLRDAIDGADAVLIATPEYNHSLPGQLKNALDWISRASAGKPLAGKPVAVVGASAGLFGAVWAQAEARKVLSALGARVVDEELPIGLAASAFDVDGRLVSPDQQATLEAIVARLVALTEPAGSLVSS